jgi:Zn-finger domain-containing protein
MKMTKKENLIRDVTTIRESINRDWADLSSILSLSHDDRTAIRAHIEQCVQDLKELTERLDRLSPDSN